MVEKVFALGGSVINNNFSDIGELAEGLEGGAQIAVVTGAGHLKKHQDAVRDSANNAETDMVGIAATRLNAKTIQTLMESAYPSVPETVEEVQEAATTGKNVVMGGLNPGFSTDAVAATVAELFDADLYIVTDVDGIYSKDPENPDAKRIDEIGVAELLEKVSGHNVPGRYDIVDETAVGIIQRSGIRTKVFEGSISNIESPEKADGTVIVND